MNVMNRAGIPAVAFTLLLGLSGIVRSDGDGRDWEDDDHTYDRARRAVQRGEILPMATLLERLQSRIPGELVEVELEREHGQWVYEFKVIDARGRLLEIYMDARTGAVFPAEDD
jgi:uncharacterized membrane protein YkoI